MIVDYFFFVSMEADGQAAELKYATISFPELDSWYQTISHVDGLYCSCLNGETSM